MKESDLEKYEIATRLNIDLTDKEHLTAAEAGRVGGLLAKHRKIEKRKQEKRLQAFLLFIIQ